MLCLAAAPVFAALALLTAGGGDMICTMPGMSALGGMSLMYLLMSLFHLAPWLKRNSRNTRKGDKRWAHTESERGKTGSRSGLIC